MAPGITAQCQFYTSHSVIAAHRFARQTQKVLDMNNTEEQQLIHGISGLAQSVHTLLELINELKLGRRKADDEIINLLKLISRKH